MIGVVLAGGLGTRLLPLTRAVNKHLLPVGPKPMLFYPLERMAEAGITRVVIVVGGKSTGDIIQTVRDGKELGLQSVSYVYQEGEGGIAAALACAAGWCNDEDICVVLGDNIFDFSLRHVLEDYTGSCEAAHVVLVPVDEPQHYGVPEFRGRKIVHITEKPVHPVTNYAVTGIYLYRADVFSRLRELKPSGRNELEISDLNNLFAEDGNLGYSIVSEGSWFDAGSSLEALVKGMEWVKSKNVVVEETK